MLPEIEYALNLLSVKSTVIDEPNEEIPAYGLYFSDKSRVLMHLTDATFQPKTIRYFNANGIEIPNLSVNEINNLIPLKE